MQCSSPLRLQHARESPSSRDTCPTNQRAKHRLIPRLNKTVLHTIPTLMELVTYISNKHHMRLTDSVTFVPRFNAPEILTDALLAELFVKCIDQHHGTAHIEDQSRASVERLSAQQVSSSGTT